MSNLEIHDFRHWMQQAKNEVQAERMIFQLDFASLDR